MARIFILDPNEKVKANLKQLLHAEGHETILFNSEEDFRPHMEENIFDAVIIDLNADIYQPFQKIEWIRSTTKNKNAYIIGTMTKTTKELFDLCRKYRVDQIFIKPYRYKVLSEKIQTYFQPIKNANAAFDTSVIKIFLEATTQIFKANAGIALHSGKPFLKTSNKSIHEVSAIVGLSSSQIKGSMTVNVNKSLLEKTLVKMLGEKARQKGKIQNEDINDICGELANQILGRAKQQFLRSRNMTFEMTMPSLLNGQKHILNYKLGAPVLAIPFSIEKKECLIVEFCLDFNHAPVVVPSEMLTVAAEDGEFVLF
ncbi:MAG: chemotaxis protein CheX [Silvanigrellaceae bacterium]|nr:chemotaxis protein CheX [Silvanigrellaceae bacterium]